MQLETLFFFLRCVVDFAVFPRCVFCIVRFSISLAHNLFMQLFYIQYTPYVFADVSCATFIHTSIRTIKYVFFLLCSYICIYIHTNAYTVLKVCNEKREWEFKKNM